MKKQQIKTKNKIRKTKYETKDDHKVAQLVV